MLGKTHGMEKEFKRGKKVLAIGWNQWELQRIEDAVRIEKEANRDFLYEYEKAILLSLKEQGVLTEWQLVQCIERLPLSRENG